MFLHNYVIWLRFNDGSEDEIDLQCELDGEIFESGADFAPEFLHENIRALA
jgi:hypothetical protein